MGFPIIGASGDKRAENHAGQRDFVLNLGNVLFYFPLGEQLNGLQLEQMAKRETGERGKVTERMSVMDKRREEEGKTSDRAIMEKKKKMMPLRLPDD